MGFEPMTLGSWVQIPSGTRIFFPSPPQINIMLLKVNIDLLIKFQNLRKKGEGSKVSIKIFRLNNGRSSLPYVCEDQQLRISCASYLKYRLQ